MDSDSDRTVDSDELKEIISKAKKKQHSDAGKKKNAVLSHFHDLSDSDSDLPSSKKEINDSSLLSPKKKINDSSLLSPKKKINDSSLLSPKKKINDSDLSSPKKKIKRDEVGKNTERRDEVQNRPICKYGSKCYRKNADHKRNFYHPNSNLDAPSRNTKPVSSEDSLLIESVKKYDFFVTRVKGIPPRYNSAVAYDIRDLLSLPDGSLVASAQFNYMFDIEWLMLQYPEKCRKCPLTIVHGEQRESKHALEKSAAKYPNVKFCQAKLDIPFGTHHTKMMFLLYKEGFRIVIHTSNIVESDWAQKTQGMWMSPLLPTLESASTTQGESPTGFKADLLEYISAYACSALEEWCQVIQKHDFSQVKVVLIGSVPGRHIGCKKTSFGHLKLRKVLHQNGPSKEVVGSDWSIIGQFSSIGSLGPNPDQWLRSELACSLGTCKNISPTSSSLKLIYPSVENVRKSLEGYPAGASLPYSIKVAQKQPYLKSFLHCWKSERLGRSEASPHIKTYLRLSPDHKRVAWFLVTSANLSKAAWGALEKKGSQLMIRSYELGVLYLPKYFSMETFPSPLNGDRENLAFPVPYDLPPERYTPTDEPWIWDIPHIKGPDRFGNMWCPP